MQSEGRGLSSMRQAPTNAEKEKGIFEKEKNNTSRLSGNEGSTPSQEKPRGLTPGGDGWEKRIKRRRSMGSMVNRANDGAHADSKQSAPPRANINTENRRSNDNGLSFRFKFIFLFLLYLYVYLFELIPLYMYVVCFGLPYILNVIQL